VARHLFLLDNVIFVRNIYFGGSVTLIERQCAVGGGSGGSVDVRVSTAQTTFTTDRGGESETVVSWNVFPAAITVVTGEASNKYIQSVHSKKSTTTQQHLFSLLV
jgi:hypothetical protein